MGILPTCTGGSGPDGWTRERHSTACRQARCTAHPLRELPVVADALHQGWAGRLKALLRALQRAVEQARAAGATPLACVVRDRFLARSAALALVAQGVAQTPQPPPASLGPGERRRRGRRPQSPARHLLDRLWTLPHEVLAFLDAFTIPLDNNQAERDPRPIKVHQTISGTCRSELGADAFCCLRTLLSTWRQQGRSALRALEAAFAGHSLSLQLPSGTVTRRKRNVKPSSASI